MPAQSALFHTLQTALGQVLPTTRRSRIRVLALFVTGMVLARSVTLGAVAGQIAGRRASTERRLRRFLANRAVGVRALWPPVLATLLARVGPGRIWLVFDPTSHRAAATVLVLSVVVGKRTLPVAWRVVPQQTRWDRSMVDLVGEMVAEVGPAVPAGGEVTVLLDRGLISPALVDQFRAAGWHVVLRLHASPGDTTLVERDGHRVRLARLLTGPGQRTVVTGRIWKDAGWRTGSLTIVWPRDQRAPWVLFSDLPGGSDRVRDYRKRMRAEATYQDWKGRGFGLHRSRVHGHDRLDRLLLVLAITSWWLQGLGRMVIRTGLRPCYDRRDRRDASVLALAWAYITTCLATNRPIPPPFVSTPTGVRFRWKL
jgi:hypothetical protein